MYHGLMYADVRPVQDDEWDLLPHVHMTADAEWDPSAYDHGVDKGWDTEAEEDPVEEHYRDLPYNRHGDLEVELEDLSDSDGDDQGTTRAEIEAHVTEAIQDELVGSVIEYDVDGEIFHRDLSDDDMDMDWGEWRGPNRDQWYSYDIFGHRRSARQEALRKKKSISYDETQRRKKKGKATPDVPKKDKPTRRKGRRSSSATTATAPTVATVGSDSEDEPQVRTDYNNKEKSTTQNDIRSVQGGPLVGKPSTIDYTKYQRHFVGAPANVVEKTFQNTTQMGRLAAVKGVKLWKQHKAPNPALNLPRRNEAVATDTIYGPGCPAVDNGSTAAHFCGEEVWVLRSGRTGEK